jgi:hypothetical protein
MGRKMAAALNQGGGCRNQYSADPGIVGRTARIHEDARAYCDCGPDANVRRASRSEMLWMRRQWDVAQRRLEQWQLVQRQQLPGIAIPGHVDARIAHTRHSGRYRLFIPRQNRIASLIAQAIIVGSPRNIFHSDPARIGPAFGYPKLSATISGARHRLRREKKLK